MSAQQTIQELLDAGGTGVKLNGTNPWDPQVKDERLYSRVLGEGSLGLGEAYMEGWWNCKDLAELFSRIVAAHLDERIMAEPMIAARMSLFWLGAIVGNPQSIARSKVVGKVHYDDRLFATSTYDVRMTGSCGYWKNAKNVDEAQEAKLDLVARKLGVKKGDTVFDIGSGWGAFLGFAAERYGIEGVGVTISRDQVAYASERYKNLPVEFRFEDYREYSGGKGPFDHVVSMGMFEHVGEKNYLDYFKTARQLLKENGRFLLHTIVGNKRSRTIDPWLDKYIFMGGQLPTIGQIAKATEGLFVIEDVHNIGADYDPTLCAWNDNFQKHRAEIVAKEGESAARMYEYYLLQCAGGFRARGISVAQLVLSPRGVPGGYTTVR